jgi:DmsE family decaheme c-type cytochrome
MMKTRSNPSLLWAVGVGCAVALGLATPAPLAAQEAGLPVCAECHAETVAAFAVTKHGSKLDATGQICQACHGDAAAHLDDPEGAKPPHVFGDAMTAGAKTAVCQSCHDGNRQLAFWESGKHRKNEVACSDCHSIHGKRAEPSITPYLTTQRKLEYETCGECHKSIRAQLNKTSHHPILEGKVACSDCHNPHGALSPAMVKEESTNQLCWSCHTDKRGPFVWSHMPVEENCLSCHNSHGSNVPKLLTVKVPQLCQDCHGSAHGQYAYGSSFAVGGANQNNASRFDARSCVNCHQLIHGSNAPASRGLFLVR